MAKMEALMSVFCRDCAQWEPFPREVGAGHCVSESVLQRTNHSTTSRLATSPGFGCVFFEARPKDEQSVVRVVWRGGVPVELEIDGKVQRL